MALFNRLFKKQDTDLSGYQRPSVASDIFAVLADSALLSRGKNPTYQKEIENEAKDEYEMLSQKEKDDFSRDLELKRENRAIDQMNLNREEQKNNQLWREKEAQINKDLKMLEMQEKAKDRAENRAFRKSLLDQKIATKEQKPSEAVKAVDRNYGKDYAEYVAGGGYASAKKNLDQLKSVVSDLKPSGPNVSGGFLGLAPKKVRDIITPKGAAVQDAIEQTVLTTLRQTLGAQFTENEGAKVLAYTFNPRQPEEENLKRANRLIKQLENQAIAKAEAADYYETHGTLQGYRGPVVASTAEDLIGVEEVSPEITEQDIDNMSIEELKAAGLL